MMNTEIHKTKFSQFNFILPFKNKYALYNSFEDVAIFIENEINELLEVAKNKGGADYLQDVHPTFFDYLNKEKFILNTKIDELQKVKDMVSEIDNNSRIFLLTVNPTMNCNFKCWYCYETHVKQSRLEIPVSNTINKFITKKLCEGDIKHFNLAFFGGEPLLYFSENVIPIIDHLTNECRKYDKSYNVSFTTNGFLINDNFIKYFLNKNIKASFQITFDGYREQHDLVRFVSKTRGSYRQIVLNIKKLLQHNNFSVIARVNYTSENIQDCYKIVNDFEDISESIKKNRIIFDFHRVWQDRKSHDSSIDEIAEQNAIRINKKGFNVSTFCSHNGVKNSCYADKRNSAVINYNGDIYKCTARDFSSENRAGYIDSEGELIWENNSLEKRMQSKFKNKPCLTCKILPLCNGGCSQNALENNSDYCIYGDSMEEQMHKIVLARVEEIYNYTMS